ncbi:glutamate receptor 2-like [Schistocerca cancellata]|uniref:glutamate receptor 2-like n=1 Tax=Schistocerca cancellata TaxID=274614 RepID=UPI0021194461|nr:glutamate receptor 2-like [Schistocerca cancellata]
MYTTRTHIEYITNGYYTQTQAHYTRERVLTAVLPVYDSHSHVGTRTSARLDVCKYTLDVYRLLHLNSLPRLPTRSSPRCVLVAWCFFSQLLATSYSSTFTSVLTVQRYGPPIDSFRDLLQRGVFWGGRNQALQRQISVIDDPYIREFGARYREELTPQDKESRLREGRYAVFVTVINDYVTHTENLPADVRRSLRLLKETMAKYYISIALQKNSPYKSTLDRRMRFLHYSGLINYWMKHVIARLGHHYMRSFFADHADSQHEMPQKLSLQAVEGAFFIFTTGITIAFLVFLSEITYEKFCYCLQRYPKRPCYLYNLSDMFYR